MKITAVIVLLTCAVVSTAQGPVTKKAPTKPAAAKASGAGAGKADAAKFKAIWEPVPFNQDLSLNAIACVGPETCWVAGDKSTILLTTNGGKTWQVQLGGDPASTDDPLTKIVALDATHAWAITDRAKIVGTSDGKTWTELSTVSGTTRGIWFLNPQVGLELENPDSTSQSTLRRSEDGGKTWKPVSRCSVDTTIEGLPRKLDCVLRTAQFLSPTIGFTGGGAGINMSTEAAVFGKTSDGGQSWTMSVIPESRWRMTSVKFWTEKEGIAVLSDGEAVYWTGDAGGTWTRSVKQRQWPSVYGVGEGKIIVGIGESGGIGYSFNGGRNFTSRPFTIPARVNAVTFPDAQHGYLVGQHAMVYRYRIVPVEYSSAGMIAGMAP